MRSGHKALTHKWVIAAGLAVVALALVAAVVYMWLQRDEGEAADAPVFVPDEIARLTDTGNAGMAAISADGRYVAHVKLEQNMPGLWMRQTATTSDVRIVAPERVRYDGVTFSPDGNYIYYVTYPLSLGVGSLYRVPTLGGAPIRVLEDIDSAPAFSPDGERFAFARGEPARGVTHLMIAGVDGSNARSVAAPSGELRMTNDTPAWSSDGRTILVTLTKSRLSTEVVAVDAETGALTTVGEPWLYARGPQWLAGGRAFVVEGLTTMAVGMPQLWEVAYPSGQRRRLTNDLNGYRWVSASAGGKQLAAVQATREGAIWLVPANGGAGTRLSLGASRSVGFDGIDWTPDGRLVFTANIGGLSHIWIANPDGTGLRQLTSGDKYSTNPAVSPDGRWIYFTADAGDKMRIWRMGIDGSEQRAITDVLQDLMPLPSPDGEWVYFTAPAEGLNRVMRMRPDGSERTEIGKGPMFAYDISADGTEILGTAWNQERRRTECAIMPASGGVPRLLGDMALADGGMVSTCRWNPEPGVVTYAAQRNGVMNVYARPVAGGPERQLTRFTADGTPTMYSGSWSRDGRLAVTRGRETSDVVLIQSR